MSLSKWAIDYVNLVLAVGRHDANFVDAYYGPADLKAAADAGEPRPLGELKAEAGRLLAGIAAAEVPAVETVRRDYLLGQLGAVDARLAHLAGHPFSFDDEAEALYQVRPAHVPETTLQEALGRLDAILQGSGSVQDRYQRLRERILVPVDRVDAVFQAAITEARERTRRRATLPDPDLFRVEYVKDKPWSAYNWYQGGGNSVIQVNLDLPLSIDRALDLAAHEGYPGHHVYNALLEQRYAQGRGWVEFTVYPLFSPQSLIAEGTANFGIEVAFPGQERLAFERDVLFPLAGLDPRDAESWARVQAEMKVLAFADNEAARGYLDGRLDRAQAEAFLVKYSLRTEAQAAQRLRFIDAYRSYVINYNLGEQLVRDWVIKQGGTVENPARRWEVFVDLISSPRLPKALGL
ncbi:hypothetical protein GETHLI_12700 [Geothrix limicola]|uniref:DUF885 domain-containing protein n=1 Tax=Geothrix limicola TaxID=2927978 RepID=A0ABQ5QDX4_9BACT|nr:hypothetical protein [Geothrix limicola]GLH72768.1 hypothetical protein GETHLI_12700 [Geothrix limicola]